MPYVAALPFFESIIDEGQQVVQAAGNSFTVLLFSLRQPYRYCRHMPPSAPFAAATPVAVTLRRAAITRTARRCRHRTRFQ